MTDENSIPNNISVLPTEILLKIFGYLPAQESMRCRQVCRRWKEIIDELACKADWWLAHYAREFKKYHWNTKLKVKSDLDWFQLFRSMSLWSKLAEAHEDIAEFATASSITEEVLGIQILSGVLVSVHKKCGIYHYNGDTLKLVYPEPVFRGSYASYAENDYVAIILHYQFDLVLIQKMAGIHAGKFTVFPHVKLFYLSLDHLYFVTIDDMIYRYDMHGDNKVRFLRHSEPERIEGIMKLSFSFGCLNILTHERKIYSLLNGRFELKQILRASINSLDVLYKYEFLNHLDSRIYHEFELSHSLPVGHVTGKIMTIRTHGDLFFVGLHIGLLNIYYRPFIDGELDFVNSKPLRQVNFMDGSTMCLILHIDVMQTLNGLTVFVAMPKKVAVIKYTYDLQPLPWEITDFDEEESGNLLLE